MSWQVLLTPLAEAADKYGIEYFNSGNVEASAPSTLTIKVEEEKLEEVKRAIEALEGVSEVVVTSASSDS